MAGLPGWWLEDSLASRLLAPLGLLFAGLVHLRRLAYGRGWLRRYRVGAPVVVVGNILVGGTGKTPLVASVVERLRQHGWHPGILCRGYKGRAADWPQAVTAEASARDVGDEPVLLARQTGVPVMAGPDRVAAARALLGHGGCDILVLDDGLQHYRLVRDIEIAVVDARRGLGNGRCFPAGPLREPVSRLNAVDLVLFNGDVPDDRPGFRLSGDYLRAVDGSGRQQRLDAFAGRGVDAVAGIGNPDAFFARLSAAGLDVTPHAFADHFSFGPEDLAFAGNRPVLMTEKDAVKCRDFAGSDWWYLPVSAALNPAADEALEGVLTRLAAHRRVP